MINCDIKGTVDLIVKEDDNEIMQCACHFFYGANNTQCIGND